jgi:hypothetical protein
MVESYWASLAARGRYPAPAHGLEPVVDRALCDVPRARVQPKVAGPR